MPQDISNFNALEYFKNLDLEEKAKSRLTKPKAKPNPKTSLGKGRVAGSFSEGYRIEDLPGDRSRNTHPTARDTSVEEQFLKPDYRGTTKTIKLAQTEGTLENAMYQWDMAKYGKPTYGNIQDPERDHAKAMLADALYKEFGSQKNTSEVKVPAGIVTMLVDSQKRKSGISESNAVQGDWSQSPDNPRSENYDHITPMSAGAEIVGNLINESRKLPVTIPAVLSSVASGGNPLDAYQNASGDAEKGTLNEILSGASHLAGMIGPQGIASAVDQGIKGVSSAKRSGDWTQAVDAVLPASMIMKIYDPEAKPSERVLGGIAIVLASLGAAHGLESLKSKAALKSAISLVADDLKSTAPGTSSMLSRIASTPEFDALDVDKILHDIQLHEPNTKPFNREAFTKNLQSQEAPLDTSQGAIQKPVEQQKVQPVQKATEAQNGKPITVKVYHGTPDFRFAEEYKPGQPGYDPKMPDWVPNDSNFVGEVGKGFQNSDKGTFFTDDPKIADTYTHETRAFDYQNSIPKVLERHVTLQNPKVIDNGGESWKLTKEAVEKAKAEGYDGLIIKNVRDAYSTLEGKGKHYDKPATNVVAFDKSQISIEQPSTPTPETPKSQWKPPLSEKEFNGAVNAVTPTDVLGDNKFIVPDKQRGTKIASRLPNGKIELSPKFFELDANGRANTLRHESLHGLEDAYDTDPQWDSVFKSEAYQLWSTPHEALLNAIEHYHFDPNSFRSRFPETADFIESRVIPENPSLKLLYPDSNAGMVGTPVRGGRSDSGNVVGREVRSGVRASTEVSPTPETGVKEPWQMTKAEATAKTAEYDDPSKWLNAVQEQTTGIDHGGNVNNRVTGNPAVQDQPQINATGLANQVQEKEAELGVIKHVDGAQGKSKEEWLDYGNQKVKSGTDYIDLAHAVGNGKSFEPGDVAILTVGKQQLMSAIKIARNAGDWEKVDEIQSTLDNYVANIQKGKGAWSDIGRELQIGIDIDTGDFTEVIQNARERGAVTKIDEAEYKNLTDKISELNTKIAELESRPNIKEATKSVDSTPRARRFDKAVIRKRISSNIEAFKNVQSSPGVTGPKTRGAVSRITYEDIEALGERATIVKEIALDYARLGAANIEDVILKVKDVFANEGIDIADQAIIDAIATRRAPTPQSEEAKRSGDIVSQARAKSTLSASQEFERNQLREKRKEYRQWWTAQARILELEKAIESGIAPSGKSRVSSKIPDDIETLNARKRILEARLRAKLRSQDKPVALRALNRFVSEVRGVKLGSDIGVVLRQALFSISHPKEISTSVKHALSSAFSEKAFVKYADSAAEKRYEDGKLALNVRKSHGLDAPDVLSHQEEIVAAKLFRRIFGDRAGGSLERFQSTYLNSIRNELFDATYNKNLSDAELRARARFINISTGRGNIKHVPEAFVSIMNSPRYSVSRWKMIGELARNPIEAIHNRGARENLRDIATTAAGIYALYKIAETAGYNVNYNPRSSDFLKMRRGDEVWDVTAGISPVIRDVLRIALAGKDITENKRSPFKQTPGELLSSNLLKTVSPGITVPLNTLSNAAQKANGVSKPVDYLSQFAPDNQSESGIIAFTPLIFQAFWDALISEGPAQAVGAYTKEFLGTSVNRYKKSKDPVPTSRNSASKKHSFSGSTIKSSISK